jgi:hypothetical protein
MAQPIPRARVLRLFGGAIVAAAVPGPLRTRRTFGKPDRGHAPSECLPHPDCSKYPGLPVPCCCPGPRPGTVFDGRCGEPGSTCCCYHDANGTPNGAGTCPPGYRCGNGFSEPSCVCLTPCGLGDSCCREDQECCLSAASRSKFCCRKDGCCGSKCCAEDEKCAFDANHVPRCLPLCKWNELNRSRQRHYDPQRECCTRHGVTDKYPIRQYAWCRDTRVPHKGYKPTANGCGTKDHPVPNRFGRANFKPACDAHDLCYDICGKSKAACDDQFCQAVTAACHAAYRRGTRGLSACLARADDYCVGGSLGATLVGAYDDAQSKACDCC